MSARVAHQRLRRVSVQRAAFATAYGRARTPIERLVAAVSGLRAALPATSGSSSGPEPEPEVLRRLDRAAEDLADLLAEAHTAHEAAAAAVLRRRARSQSRKDHSDVDSAA